jgi:hypothetical protein
MLTRINFSLLCFIFISVFSMFGWMPGRKDHSLHMRTDGSRTETRSSAPLMAAADSTRNWYHYRIISRYYDSSQLDCMYGEVFAFDDAMNNSMRVRFKGYIPTPFDTTLQRVNEVARTRSFPAGILPNLIFYRFMSMIYPNAGQMNLGISDTTIWVVELWHTQQNQKVATLDSMVIFPKMIGIGIPPRYPEAESYATISCTLAGFNFNASDSAYLQLKLTVCGDSSANSGFAVRDIITAYYKLSDSLAVGSSKRGTPQGKQMLPVEPRIDVLLWPNPSCNTMNIRIDFRSSANCSIELLNTLGKRIGSIYRGVVQEGANHFIFRISPDLPSGEYLVVCRNLESRASISSKIIIHH